MDISTLTLSILSTAGVICSYTLWQRLKTQSSQKELETRNNNENQEKLAKSKAERRELRLLLNASNDSLIITDPNGIVQVANESTRLITTVETLRGRQIESIIRNSKISSKIKEMMQNGTPEKRTIVLNNSNLGSEQSLESSAWLIDYAPIKASKSDAPHEHTHHRFILKNVTKEHLEDPETSLTMLTTMRKHSERLELLIEDMLVISKLESGDTASLVQEAFILQKTIDTVIDRLTPLTQQQNSKIITEYNSEEIQLIGDNFYWEQALFNILENALKQNAGTALRIKVIVNANPVENLLTIKISDNGKGIPAADLPYIFNRFFRVQKHHSQNQIKGTGLGLSIVKHAIESHGGSISATSTPGIETTFTITCPLVR